MKCDFEIEVGIYLVQGSHCLDLHNFYEFEEFSYSIKRRSVILKWRRSSRPEVSREIPVALTVEFHEVSQFEFMPRNPEMPFSEDQCMSTFGNWIAEHGVVIYENGISDQEEPVAVDFMSGATIIINAASAKATIDSAKL